MRSVYLMPMTHGLDQFLANHLTANHVFQVVADPKLADAIFTDRLGEGFLNALEDFSPSPKPAAEEAGKKEDKDKSKSENSGDAAAAGSATVANPILNSAFGRGKGNVFLVDAKSREVVWSTFENISASGTRQLDRTASDIVSRLMKDMKKK